MTIQRIAAAVAAILTALLLQATLVSPLAVSTPISLPAVLVVAVALKAGAGAGISVGFAAGLLADLASDHPVGLLALVWMGLGVAAATVAEMLRSRRAQILAAAFLSLLAGELAVVGLTVLGSAGARLSLAITSIVPTFAGNLLLAAIAVPMVWSALGTQSLRRVGSGTPQLWSK